MCRGWGRREGVGSLFPYGEQTGSPLIYIRSSVTATRKVTKYTSFLKTQSRAGSSVQSCEEYHRQKQTSSVPCGLNTQIQAQTESLIAVNTCPHSAQYIAPGMFLCTQSCPLSRHIHTLKYIKKPTDPIGHMHVLSEVLKCMELHQHREKHNTFL